MAPSDPSNDSIERAMRWNREASDDDAQVWLDSQPQAVLGDQRAGERVIGRGRRLAVELDPEPLEARPDALAELGGRLGRERQPEHALRRHPEMADEPYDAGRHDGGLAGSGTRDDRAGPVEARGDGVHLRLA